MEEKKITETYPLPFLYLPTATKDTDFYTRHQILKLTWKSSFDFLRLKSLFYSTNFHSNSRSIWYFLFGLIFFFSFSLKFNNGVLININLMLFFLFDIYTQIFSVISYRMISKHNQSHLLKKYNSTFSKKHFVHF